MSPRSRWNLLLLVPLGLALVVSADVLLTFAARFSYPYDLEWMEGGVLAHAWRAAHGKTIYPDPGPEFLPMVYTPGYYWLVGALSWVFGLSAPLGRAVSVFGTLAACVALVWGGAHYSRRGPLGLLGVAVYLGAYEHSGAFYDLVRPDALAVGLLSWALVLTPSSDRRHRDAAAVLLFLAFTVKHNVAAFGVPLALGLWVQHGLGAVLRFTLISATPALLFTGVMQLTTHGNFLHYVLDVPASHPIKWDRALPGSARELGRALPAACLAVAGWLIVVAQRGTRLPAAVPVGLCVAGAAAAARWLWTLPEVDGIPPSSAVEELAAYVLLGTGAAALTITALDAARTRKPDARTVYVLGVLSVAVVITFIMRAHHGGFTNVFMPLHWVVAAAFVALVADLLDELPDGSGVLIASLVAVSQPASVLMTAKLDRLVPTEADVAAGDEIVAYLRDAPGPVLSPYAPFLPVLAGHEPSFHLISLWDLKHPEGPFRAESQAINEAIAKGWWATVVDAQRSMGFGVGRSYHKVFTFTFRDRSAPEPADGGRRKGVFMPVTGWPQRPAVIWARGAAPDAPQDADLPPEESP